ncbi:MAG: TonB-dependent receptor [Bacteroidota bacterium]
MKKKLNIYSLVILILLSIGINAQNTKPLIQSKLDGTVIDNITNEPIPGATVTIKGITHSVTTDAEGKFYFQTGQKFPYTLIISYIGYKKTEVVANGSPIIISLKSDVQELNELVVVGYGTQKKKDITGAVSSVPKGNLSQVTSSADNLLRGAVSGVVVTQSSGRPGATSSVRIRGGNSITAGNEPLYVVDGILIYNDNSNGTAGVSNAGAGVNVLSTISPGDIESIDVLKDASATAIYGSRGANGVVIITTKKGIKGQDIISYQGYFGFQKVSKKIDLLNASDWASLRNDVQASIGQAPSFTPVQIEALKTSGGYDWQSALFRTAPVQNHQLSFSGGDDRSRYAVSGGFFDQKGIVIGSDFRRISLRANYERNYSQTFKFGVNSNYSNSLSNGIGTNNTGRNPNPLVVALYTPPVVPIKNADGSYNLTNNPYSTAVNGIIGNPINDLEATTNTTKIDRILTSLFGEYKLSKEITAKVAVSGDVINTKQNYYAPSTTTTGAGTKGLASVGNRLVSSVLNENTLNFNTHFGDNHKFSALAGYTLQYTQGEVINAGANSFVNDANTYNALQDGVAVKPYSDAFESVLKSYLTRVNYSYKGKYNLTVSARADGSSRFGSKSLWGYFPSAGFSWNITDEDFAESIKGVVTDAKLRLSAGTTGNQEIGNYLSLASIGSVNYSFGGTIQTGLTPTRLANPDLRWEKTNQYNVGLDLSLLDRKINFVFDVYYKKTNDLLVNVPVPLISGYSAVLQNIGGVENKGIEIGIITENLKTENFSWNTNFVFSANRNKVLEIGNGVDQFFPVVPNGTLLQQQPVTVKVGLPLGTFWGYKTNGIFQTQEEINTQPKINSLANTKIGDRKYVDTNGDGVITATDKGNLGSSQPKIVASFSNTISYNDFDLQFSLQGSYGGKIFNALNQQLEISTLGTNAATTLIDRWTPTNTNTDIPRATSSPLGIVSERYIEDASFLRLKTITLGYTLPKSITSKIGLKSAKLYVSAENLFTWTKYSGFDPEVSSYEQNNLYPGIDFGAYPNSKTFITGLNLTF